VRGRSRLSPVRHGQGWGSGRLRAQQVRRRTEDHKEQQRRVQPRHSEESSVDHNDRNFSKPAPSLRNPARVNASVSVAPLTSPCDRPSSCGYGLLHQPQMTSGPQRRRLDGLPKRASEASPSAVPAKAPRGMTPEGRQRLAAAMKQRWAVKRKGTGCKKRPRQA
jgi:hypothetical protein